MDFDKRKPWLDRDWVMIGKTSEVDTLRRFPYTIATVCAQPCIAAHTRVIEESRSTLNAYFEPAPKTNGFTKADPCISEFESVYLKCTLTILCSVLTRTAVQLRITIAQIDPP